MYMEGKEYKELLPQVVNKLLEHELVAFLIEDNRIKDIDFISLSVLPNPSIINPLAFKKKSKEMKLLILEIVIENHVSNYESQRTGHYLPQASFG